VIDLLLAAPGIALEPALVAAAPGRRVRVLRRCLDAADLLAASAAEPEAVVAVSAGLPRLSSDVVSRLRGEGARAVVGLAGDPDDARRLRAVGVPTVVTVGDDPGTVLTSIVEVAAARSTPDATDPLAAAGSSGQAAAGCPVPRVGEIVAVWGPQGAPGRTTVAIGLAEALAAGGRRVCLVDADTYAPSITLALGIVEEASGIVVACRRAEAAGGVASGSATSTAVSSTAVSSAARAMAGGWDVLGGLPTPERWSDLRPAGLERLWGGCALAYDVTVVDVGFCLESDEADPWARSRNAAAVSALAAAGHLVAVGDSSAAGAVRMATAWPAVERLRSGRPVVMIRNRATGRDRGWEQVLRGVGAPAPAVTVPEDGRALSACWRRGRTLAEGARRSPVRRALGDLSRMIVSG
jgi:hypothetical protein